MGNLVSCTGAQFCGLAMIETKQNAESIAADVEERVIVERDVRIHWNPSPPRARACVGPPPPRQVQAADIGLMGGPAKKMNEQGQMKAVPGVKVRGRAHLRPTPPHPTPRRPTGAPPPSPRCSSAARSASTAS